MITKTTTNMMVSLGVFALFAVALFLPLDAFAQTGTVGTTDISQQASILSKQLINVPKIIAVSASILGVCFVLKGLLLLRSYVDDPAENSFTGPLGYFVAGALCITLPYGLGIMQKSMGANSQTVSSSSASFADQGF